MHRIPLLLGGLTTAFLQSPVSASDLAVNPTRPGAYPTLQAAHDAAQPGDRILIEVNLPTASQTIIRKSLTIESVDALHKTLPYVGNAPGTGQILIEAITPGIPLILRVLNLEFRRDAGGLRRDVGLRTARTLGGRLVLDDVHILISGQGPVTNPVTLVDVDVNEMWIRDSLLLCRDTAPVPGCPGGTDRDGSDCLHFAGRILYIANVDIYAGSAAFIPFSTCGGGNQAPQGGRGGQAIVAANDATILVRSDISDGNGGDVQTGLWASAPVPGVATPSVFMSPGPPAAIFAAYNSRLEQARVGRVAANPDPTRAAFHQLGITADPFLLTGEGRLGGTVRVEMNSQPGQTNVVFLAQNIGLFPNTPFGGLWLALPQVYPTMVFIGPGSTSLPVPNSTALIGTLLIGQAITLNPGVFTNPSALFIRQ